MRKTLGLVLASLLAFALLPHAPALAATDTYEMVFPVAGPHHYTDTFGAPRSGGRTHQGNDIMADKMTPILAVADGTVGWMHDEQGGNCCAMSLNHDDGWSSWYIHMNNDTPGTDDGQGWGFAPGITTGVHVVAGQLIGWVGDSGNAENVAPHLHFELHTPDGVAIDPYPSLIAAEAAADPIPRLAGLDRYGTAAEISKEAFPSGSDRVYLATGMDFPDALIIGPVAGIQNHPVLLVTKDVVPTVTTRELQRLNPSTITLVGGTESISDDVVARLHQLFSAKIERIPGSGRFETAAAVSALGFPSGASVAFVANGDAYPDALTGAVAAAQEGGPLLLVELNGIPEATATELERLHPDRIVILGGEGVVSATTKQALEAFAPTVDRAWGWDRYGTAVAISQTFFPDGAPVVYIATGLNFPDALAGTPLAALRNGPILLVSNTVPSIILTEIARLAPSSIVILGGTGAVPLSVSYTLAAYVN